MAQERADRPGHGMNSIAAVLQARVDPHTIALPIVDDKAIRFTRLSTNEGLSQTKVSQIRQDGQGFMWFGTQYGVNRYDGYNFKLFIHDPGKPNSLSGVYVSALFKDRDGALWVGCDQFVNKFNRATETFTRYPVPFVTHISQDSAGILWLSTVNGLYSLDPPTGTIRQYSHHPNDPSSLSDNRVESSGEDREGKFWVATVGHLDEFDRKTGKITLDIPIPGQFGFHEDRFGVFWIFHNSPNALAVFDRNTKTLRNFSFHEPEPSSAALRVIMDMTEDRNGNLWLATHGAGLLKFDREHQRLIRYRNNPCDPNSLPQNDIESLFADREGSVWVALGRMGITHFATNPLPFKTIPHLASSEGTAQPFVGAIYEDRQGMLWVGTPEALNGIDRKTGHYASYRRTSEPAVRTDVIAISEDRSGNLWAGTYGHGLLRLDRRNGSFQTYRHNPDDPYSLSNDIVTRLLVDHTGTFWVATDDGLNRFDPATGHFTVYKLDPQRIIDYLAMAEDRQGALWLGTDSSGLQRFDPATGQFITFKHDMDRPFSLSDNRVNSVHFDRSGTMWVGTQNGLDKFDSKAGTFTVYTRRDGLPGNAVSCVLEDDHGKLWMSTNNGIARFDPQSAAVKSYSTAEGLPGPDLTGWGACFKNRSGEMFFGGFNGATVFHPDRVADPSYTPPIVLTEFRLSGSPVEIGGGSPLSKSITYTSRLTLSHEQRIFSLGFSALSFLSSGTNRYRYKLEGLEDKWHEAGSDERLATYTTLPSGVYTFRVEGATSRGAWSEPGAQLRIEILPPWWGTWWFQASCVAAFLVLLSTLHRYRLHRVAQEFNARLEERVDERTRIARELHDTLLQSFHGLLPRLQAACRLLPGRVADARQVLEAALEDAAQAVTQAREAVQDLRTSTTVTNDLAKAIEAVGEQLAIDEGAANGEATDFSIEVEGTPRDLHPILRDDIYRIVAETVRNAFRHARARRIEVEIIYEAKQLRVRVRDNGIGMDASVLKQGRPGHFGLAGMRERATRIGARLEVWSEASSSTSGGGTEVELIIPASMVYRKHRGPPFSSV